jgi:hypothetical protein
MVPVNVIIPACREILSLTTTGPDTKTNGPKSKSFEINSFRYYNNK